MDHRVSKDMISSGMTPSGQKNQKELGGSQYGSAATPNSLMDAYRSIYEHHQKDENGNTVPHEEDVKEGKINPGLQAYLDKKKGKKGNGDDKEEKNGKGSKGSKPDFLDLDKDGDKKEPMKKASKEMKKEDIDLPENRVSPQMLKMRTSRQTPSKPAEKPVTTPFSNYLNKSLSKPSPQTNSVDLFDLVKGKLIDEGREEKEALKIMANMTKEEFERVSEGLAGMAAKTGVAALGAYGVKKAAEKLGTMFGTPPKPKTKPSGLIQKLKDRRDATNKAIEQM